MVHHWPDTLAPPAVPDCGVDACWHAPPYLRIGICSDQTAQIKWNMTRQNGYVTRVTAKRNRDNERWIADGIQTVLFTDHHYVELSALYMYMYIILYIHIYIYTTIHMSFLLTCTYDTNLMRCVSARSGHAPGFKVPSCSIPFRRLWGKQTRRCEGQRKEPHCPKHSAASQKSWGMLSSEQ